MSCSPPRTLYDKICAAHTVRVLDAQNILLYVDRHILNEYTSPQAFSGLREARRQVWRPQHTFAVVDHVNPTRPQSKKSDADDEALAQIEYLERNCTDFGIEMFGLFDRYQGIEHVTIPEQGLVTPGMVVVCGDSHTTTYGALGALGFGIGTSEVEHVLATQTLVHKRLKNFRVVIEGILGAGITAKDLVMAIIGHTGASGAIDHVVEFAGDGFFALSVEGRMTVCNMIVEAGARGALAKADDAVLSYLQSKRRAPKQENWVKAVRAWSQLSSDEDAVFDKEIRINASEVEPLITWGTSPEQVLRITDQIPDPASEVVGAKRRAMERALGYMGLSPGTPMQGIRIDRAFIGSCTNGRIEDLRDAARVVEGRKVASHVKAMIVPGSQEVRRVAELEGLADVFTAAGFEWHNSGCSMCLAMNGDLLPAGERCASSTNRNFEGRQGQGGRTHLMSPAMVAAAAICGEFVDVRDFVSG